MKKPDELQPPPPPPPLVNKPPVKMNKIQLKIGSTVAPVRIYLIWPSTIEVFIHDN